MRLLEHQHAGDAMRRVAVRHLGHDVRVGPIGGGEHQAFQRVSVIQELSIAAVQLEQQVLGDCVHGRANLRPSSARRGR